MVYTSSVAMPPLPTTTTFLLFFSLVIRDDTDSMSRRVKTKSVAFSEPGSFFGCAPVHKQMPFSYLQNKF